MMVTHNASMVLVIENDDRFAWSLFICVLDEDENICRTCPREAGYPRREKQWSAIFSCKHR